MGNSVNGSCFCGQVRFEVVFPTEFFSHCHCSACRKSHGATPVAWSAVDAERFRIEAGAELLNRYRSPSGAWWEFCRVCGASMLYTIDSAPRKVYFTVASLDGPMDRSPQAHVSCEEAMPWALHRDGLPRYRGKGVELME